MKRIFTLSALLLMTQANCLNQIKIELDGELCAKTFACLNMDMRSAHVNERLGTLLHTEQPFSPAGLYNHVADKIKYHISRTAWHENGTTYCYAETTINEAHAMIPAIVQALLRAHLSKEETYYEALQELYDAGLLKKPDQNNCEKELEKIKKMFEQLMATKMGAKD